MPFFRSDHEPRYEAPPARAASPPGGGAIAVLGISPAALETALETRGLPLGLARPGVVPSTYLAGKHGVAAEITMAGEDAEILTEMGQVAALLHVLAGRMNKLAGFMGSTRDCIKHARALATELQEEIEVRRGPQG